MISWWYLSLLIWYWCTLKKKKKSCWCPRKGLTTAEYSSKKNKTFFGTCAQKTSTYIVFLPESSWSPDDPTSFEERSLKTMILTLFVLQPFKIETEKTECYSPLDCNLMIWKYFWCSPFVISDPLVIKTDAPQLKNSSPSDVRETVYLTSLFELWMYIFMNVACRVIRVTSGKRFVVHVS